MAGDSGFAIRIRRLDTLDRGVDFGLAGARDDDCCTRLDTGLGHAEADPGRPAEDENTLVTELRGVFGSYWCGGRHGSHQAGKVRAYFAMSSMNYHSGSQCRVEARLILFREWHKVEHRSLETRLIPNIYPM
jgi:hypothetical protein